MSKIETAIIAEALLLSTFVLLHLAVSRFLQPVHRWQALKRLFVPFLATAICFGYWLNKTATTLDSEGLGILSAIVIVWLIHIGYLTVYAVFDRSISLRVLIEIHNGPTNLTFNQIENLYDPDEAFRRRLEILVESGFLRLENGRYFLLQKGSRTGRTIRFLKELYRTGEGG